MELAGDFWKPLAVEVLASLGDQRCLRDDRGVWRTPGELRLQPSGAGGGLLCSDELHAACGVAFLEPQLAAALAQTGGGGGAANANMLGVQPLSTAELLRTLEHLRRSDSPVDSGQVAMDAMETAGVRCV